MGGSGQQRMGENRVMMHPVNPAGWPSDGALLPPTGQRGETEIDAFVREFMNY